MQPQSAFVRQLVGIPSMLPVWVAVKRETNVLTAEIGIPFMCTVEWVPALHMSTIFQRVAAASVVGTLHCPENAHEPSIEMVPCSTTA